MPARALDWRSLFWQKVQRSESRSECWMWTGATLRGYGQFAIQRRPRRAHRLAYEMERGPIPDGLDLDHICRVRRCVNPWHLRPLSRRENTLAEGSLSPARSNFLKTRCMRGHPFSGGNVVVSTSPTNPHLSIRTCRSCTNLRRRRHNSTKRGHALCSDCSGLGAVFVHHCRDKSECERICPKQEPCMACLGTGRRK